MSLWKRIKAAFHRYLEDMAEENKKSFGSGKLDCCQLNKKPDNNKTA
jgi:hypothetical protein